MKSTKIWTTTIVILVAFSEFAISQAPVALFQVRPRSVCIGTTLNFQDTSLNNPTSWSWTFEGGTPANSNLQNPSVTYNSLGTFDVTLMVSNASGSDTNTKSNRITVKTCTPSKGIYRIPYANGTGVKITNDHINHSPVQLRIDMVGETGANKEKIVAAEDGVIMFIEDSNTDSQGACSNNNYVWIAHPNGEWTKYSHMATGSTLAAGRFVGETVCAGTYLGDESDIGCATGPHLHWEVAVPFDLSDPINPSGGFIKGVNLLPIICDITNNVFLENQTYTAGSCSAASCANNVVATNYTFTATEYGVANADQTITSPANGEVLRFNLGSTGVFRSGNTISLKPGFRARRGSSFRALIRNCNSSPGLASCNIAAAQESSEQEVRRE